jgi:Vacuolar sorting-associated protein 13, N-terminal/N-terminal region of Chorein or VPS13
MVIKSKIYDFLKKNLGEYLYGFQKNQLDVGLLSGHIDLVNVNFRPDKVNQLLGALGLPIQIKAGLLGKLRLKCHYTSFFSSPVEVEIDELLLVFGPITHVAREEHTLFEDENDTKWEVEIEQKLNNQHYAKPRNVESRGGTPSMYEDEDPKYSKKRPESSSFGSEDFPKNYKRKDIMSEDEGGKHKKKTKNIVLDSEEDDMIKDYNNYSQNNSTPKYNSDDKKNSREKSGNYNSRPPRYDQPRYQPEQPPQKESFMEKYFSKVLKNLILTVKCVHIRYEDETYPYQNPFAIGISLSRLDVKNISHEYVYKDLKISKKSPRKNSIIKEVNLQSFGVYIYSMASVLIPTSLWEATIHSEIGIFEAFPAYEVRELIIQESETLSKGHTSTFIEPTNISLCISFYEEAPTLRIAGMIDKVKCKFTASMAECIRNFFDYCTNIQIWPLVLRFRPYCRIPERPEKREHRKERRKRREIVKLWFQYAFAFVKTKRAAIKYVREKKKDNEHFRKLEFQEKIREKVEMGMKKDYSETSTAGVSTETSKNSILSNSKRKTPGVSGVKLNEIIKDGLFNRKPSPVSPQKRRPYDGEKYFPKSIVNSDIEITLNTLDLSILDEDIKISLEIEGYDILIVINTIVDEMKSAFSMGGYTINIKDNTKVLEIIRSGRKKSYFDSKTANLAETPAFKYLKTYRPAEVIIPNDSYLCLNMYESLLQVNFFTATYTHNTLNHFFLIKESMELDKCFRDNMDIRYIKAFKKHCKKHRLPKVFGVDLKKYAVSKYISEKIIDVRDKTKKYVKEKTADSAPVLYNFKAEIEGAVINFHDFAPSVLFTAALPKTCVEIGKTKDLAFFNFLGFSLETSSGPAAVYELLITGSSIIYEKIKQINMFSSYRHI